MLGPPLRGTRSSLGAGDVPNRRLPAEKNPRPGSLPHLGGLGAGARLERRQRRRHARDQRVPSLRHRGAHGASGSKMCFFPTPFFSPFSFGGSLRQVPEVPGVGNEPEKGVPLWKPKRGWFFFRVILTHALLEPARLRGTPPILGSILEGPPHSKTQGVAKHGGPPKWLGPSIARLCL